MVMMEELVMLQHRCRDRNPRGPGSRTLTDGQRDEGHLDEERKPAQHVHEPHGAPAPPAPRPPGRACAFGLRRHGAAATVAASPPRGRRDGRAPRPRAARPERRPSAEYGRAPPAGAEDQPPRAAYGTLLRPPGVAPREGPATQPGGGDAAPAGGTAFRAPPGRSGASVEGAGAREGRLTAAQPAAAGRLGRVAHRAGLATAANRNKTAAAERGPGTAQKAAWYFRDGR